MDAFTRTATEMDAAMKKRESLPSVATLMILLSRPWKASRSEIARSSTALYPQRGRQNMIGLAAGGCMWRQMRRKY